MPHVQGCFPISRREKRVGNINKPITNTKTPAFLTIQNFAMAAAQKLYPRATLKKIVKAHSKRNLSKNVDVLIFLDYVLFLETLMKEAGINAKRAGERGISAKSVKKVTESALSKFKG
ncbi:hypothetical protein ACMFMG_006694 [Clarireedia jacksonii]